MGNGFWSRSGEKKVEGSGRTVDCVWGKRNGEFGSLRIGSGGGDMVRDSGGEGQGLWVCVVVSGVL